MLKLSQVGLAGRLQDITVSASAGQFIHLLGANGAGKSSLLSVIAGLLPVDQGRIDIQGRAIDQFSLGQLAQFRCLQEQQQRSAFAITVEESLRFFTGHARLPAMLSDTLEINEFLQRPLGQLSGGENRRVHIARCLLQIWPAIDKGQGLILLDEPVQGLDFRHQHLLCRLLQALAAKGNVILMSHHDLNLCQQYASRLWLLADGRLLEQPEGEGMLDINVLENVFTCRVRQMVDEPGNKIFQTYLD
jgi:vitamin B12 transport system ATP-binding protein